jgi:hypothetical protein
MKISALVDAYRRLPQHTRFAIEVVLSLFIAVFGGFLAAKTGGKLNAKANGDIRAAAAQERIAEALERAYPPRAPLSEPSLLRDLQARSDASRARSLKMLDQILIDLKPIPGPDPEPCENAMTSKGADARFAQYACAQ